MKSFKIVERENNTLFIVYLGWFAIALFYFYQYILRVAPGVLVTDLKQTFHLTAEQFSTLGAFYLYAYSLCQIPLGILVDYIGVRKTVVASVVLTLGGAFLLSVATSLGMLQLSRILVGVGSACAFMCSLKLVVDYLPIGKRGFLMGATLTLGTLGAIVAGKPLALLADYTGWRESISYAAYLGLIILLVALLGLPKPRKESLMPRSPDLTRAITQSLIEVVKTPPVMVYAVLAIGVYTPLSVLADLWGVSFLMQKYDLSRAVAAETTMMMYFGLAMGCLILPWLSEKYHFLNRSIQASVLGVLVIFALLLYGPLLPLPVLQFVLILLGIFCGAEMLCFAGASRYTHVRNVGTTLGVVNTLNMLGGGLLQQLIGWLLDSVWSGKMEEGVRIYSTNEYTIALSVLVFVIAICCALSFRLPRDKL